MIIAESRENKSLMATSSKQSDRKIYFSDIFGVSHKTVEKYGALDISLVCDNPAFVDPFLIFARRKYKGLHDLIIAYLTYLRDLSIEEGDLDAGKFNHYYKFPEVKEVWLGYSVDGNAGLGLGVEFADSLYSNLNKFFANQHIAESSHLEKLCLVEEGVGVDKISDFTLNLIKKYLLEYTQTFAKKYLNKEQLADFPVRKVDFDFKKGIWKDASYTLPSYEWKGKKQYVLLVPRDILTKHDTWIAKDDFLENDGTIFGTISNAELREKINRFFQDNLAVKVNKKTKKPEKDHSRKSQKAAFIKTAQEYPEILDYYIKYKEQQKDQALTQHVALPEYVNFFPDVSSIQESFKTQGLKALSSFDDCVARMSFFKRVLESNSGKLYIKEEPLLEKQLGLMFKMVTYNSLFSYDSEVNNGRGPIDFIVSYGRGDKTGLELKRASNTKLKQNLQNQSEVYKEDSDLKHTIKVIFFFSDAELERVNRILRELDKVADNTEIFLVDCRKKESASNKK
jgi:hypothetical protein